MLSMTHSTESKEKKEIWGNRVQTQGWDAQEWELPRREPPSVTLIRAWRASSLLEGINGHPLRCWAPASQWTPDPGTYH